MLDFIGIYPPQIQDIQWPASNPLNDTTLLTFAHPLAAITDAALQG
jgi:hypothetical protein